MPELTLEQLKCDLVSLATSIFAPEGVDVIDITLKQRPQELLIEILADKPLGGISIEQCVQLNRAMVKAIDNTGILPEDGYALELASPGIDRPLLNQKDFMRNLNRAMRVFLKEPVDGKKEWQGTLMGVANGQLTVFTGHDKQVVVSLDKVTRGMLVI